MAENGVGLGDACSAILAFIIVKLHVQKNTLTNHLGLPFLVMEECIRNNESSSILRSQLWSYLVDNPSVMGKIPPDLARQLQYDCSRDGATTDSVGEQGYPMSALDEFSRQHFTRLQGSVGQGFISILSNPMDSVDVSSSSVSSWIGGKLFDAFDYNGSAAAPLTLLDRLQEHKIKVAQQPGSSTALLAEHPAQSDFSDYVKMISAAYQANSTESRSGLGYVESLESAKETLPWPDDVPREFFEASFDGKQEVYRLPAATSVTLSMNEPNGEVSGIVNKTTFTKDFEVLEARLKELRTWEESVEMCLLKHVQSKSEDFFTSTTAFENLEGEARKALEDTKEVNHSGVVKAFSSVEAFLRMGVLYRRRVNCATLSNFSTKIETILEFASSIENWISLPERDLGELPTFLGKVDLLESLVRGEETSDQLSHLSLANFSGVQCLSRIPERVRVIKEGMRLLVKQLMVNFLSKSTTASVSADVTATVCEAAVHLGILSECLLEVGKNATQGVWSFTREKMIAFLLNSGSLDDSKANQLLSASNSEGTADRVKEFEKVVNVVNECGFEIFHQLLIHLVHELCEHFTDTMLNWTIAITERVYPALEKYPDSTSLISSVTRKLCDSLIQEEDSLLSFFIESRAEKRSLSNVEEIEKTAHAAFRLKLGITEFLQRLSHDAAVPISKELENCSLSFPLVQTAIVKHAKVYFKTLHSRQTEKLKLILESEDWNAKESVDSVFQVYVQRLCGCSEKDVALFDELAVTEENISRNMAKRKPKSTFKDKREDELLNAVTNKLYLSLDGDADGRVVCDATLILFELLQSYDTFLGQFPSLAFEVVSRALELIRLYDASTADLILNAGAVRKGVLKTITVNNLCIASQPLALLYEFLPKWKEHLLLVLPRQFTTTEKEEASKAARSAARVDTFIQNEVTSMMKSLKTHHEQCLGRVSTVVERKVNELEALEKGTWTRKGNEWIMMLLREVARLLRTVKPLLPMNDLYGVAVPLIRTLTLKVKEFTSSIPATDTESRELASSDVLLFKVNVEKFGFDVLSSVDKGSIEVAIASPASFKASSTDEEVLKWFFNS